MAPLLFPYYILKLSYRFHLLTHAIVIYVHRIAHKSLLKMQTFENILFQAIIIIIGWIF